MPDKYEHLQNVKWQVTYDNDKLAYRIDMSIPKYEKINLAWDPSSGHNVFGYDKRENANQYWLFRKVVGDTYEIISAADVTKYLNVDSDQRNVSVANRRQEYNQQFIIKL